MQRQPAPFGDEHAAASSQQRSGAEFASATASRILLVSADADYSARAAEVLSGTDIRLDMTTTARSAAIAMGSNRLGDGRVRYEVALVDITLPDADGMTLIECAHRGGMDVVLSSRDGGFDEAVRAMRAGASDFLVGTDCDDAFVERIRNAANRAQQSRKREQRTARIKRISQRLDIQKQDLVNDRDQFDSDLVDTCQELAEHMNQVTIATEFGSLVRQDLDVESLLRTTLEYVLGRAGPTNAAVFLPTTTGDYSLGAYVNYDCPTETADILLDHLANTIAPRFEHQIMPAHLTSRMQLDQVIGDDADWLNDSHLIALASQCEDETLAIILLFRDQRNGFASDLPQIMKTISDLFAEQLARVIRVHHRHLPKDQWKMIGDVDFEEDAEGDDFVGDDDDCAW